MLNRTYRVNLEYNELRPIKGLTKSHFFPFCLNKLTLDPMSVKFTNPDETRLYWAKPLSKLSYTQHVGLVVWAVIKIISKDVNH